MLQSLVLGVAAPEEFLLAAMEPPAAATVQEAVSRLLDVGAVVAAAGGGGGGPRRCGGLTDLGRVCAELPLDIQLTRRVLLGRVFGVTGDAVELAACMSSSRLFRRGHQDAELEAFQSRLQVRRTAAALAFGSLSS